MLEAIKETPGVLETLIEIIPYAGAVAVNLIILCVFIGWVLKYLGRRDDLVIRIIKENTVAWVEVKEIIRHHFGGEQ